jgi:hypothetical protein
VIAIKQHTKASVWRLTPLFGNLLYLLLYFIAAMLYPGGSQFDKTTKGYSLTKNYWCNLLSEKAINGEVNPARPIALAALVVICISLAAFWYLFPLQADFKKKARLTIQLSGGIAMFIALFIFTGLHDQVINVACLFGLIALAGTFIGLKKLNLQTEFRMGLFIVVLVGLNNLFYHSEALIHYLPLVQIISFLYVILWISWINLRLYKLKSF